MQIDWSIVLFEALNFGILVLIARRFLFRPVRRILEQRRVEIEKLRTETEAREAAAAKSKADLEADRHALTRDKDAERARAVAEGRTRADALVDEAREAAQRLISGAQDEIVRARAHALQAIRREVAELALDAATRVVADVGAPPIARMYARRAAHALEEASGARGRADVVVRATISEDADPAEIERELRDVLGPSMKVQVEVDPDLVAGVRLRAGPHEVEASASASLRAWYEGVMRTTSPDPLDATG